MRKYLITSNEFYSDNPVEFRSTLEKQLKKHKPDYALYRDKKNPNYESLAEDFMEVCSRFKDVKALIHRDFNLARRLNADGVHLTSSAVEDIQKARKLGLKVVISAHSHDEVLNAERLGADYVTYSPIFQTPNKGEPKGLEDLKELLTKCSVKVFALGGIIEQEQIQELSKTKSYGFASIRYFH